MPISFGRCRPVLFARFFALHSYFKSSRCGSSLTKLFIKEWLTPTSFTDPKFIFFFKVADDSLKWAPYDFWPVFVERSGPVSTDWFGIFHTLPNLLCLLHSSTLTSSTHLDLFIPTSWNPDSSRCRLAQIPNNILFSYLTVGFKLWENDDIPHHYRSR